MIVHSLVILWIGNLGGAQLGWFFCWSYPRSSHQPAMPLQLDGLGWPRLCLMGVGCCLGRIDSPACGFSSWLARAHSHHGLRILDAAKTRQAPMYLLLFQWPKASSDFRNGQNRLYLWMEGATKSYCKGTLIDK